MILLRDNNSRVWQISHIDFLNIVIGKKTNQLNNQTTD
jgi:hypothetical protein